MSETTSIVYVIDGIVIVILGALLLAFHIARGKSWAYVLLLALIFGIGVGIHFVPKTPVYVYDYEHDGCCRVLSVSEDKYTWDLLKKDGPFTANFCKDYNIESYDPQPGLWMWKMAYEDLGKCWSVRRKDLGFWWMRGQNKAVVSDVSRWAKFTN